jgi:hypothetical protein
MIGKVRRLQMTKGYVIVDAATRSKRARVVNSKGEAELTPFFTYPAQAMQFIIKKLNNSPAVTIKKVGGDL